MELLEYLIKGELPPQKAIEAELYEICDREHSSCSTECPVYRLNGNFPVGHEKPFDTNGGCDCFKDGHEMFIFIKNKLEPVAK